MDARSPRAHPASARPRILILVATLALLCLAALVTRAPATRASGIPLIQATPWTITPGMTVSITLNNEVVPSTPIPLRLYASLQQAGNQQCPGAQPIPGLSTLTITPPRQGVTATFAWPTQLGVGTWWLCTFTPNTNDVYSWSDQPLVVATIFPTPTPIATVTLRGSPSSVPAGTTLTFDITNWDPNQRFAEAIVVADSGPNAEKFSGPTLVVHTVALNPPNTLVVSVTLGQSLSPGLYHLLFSGTQPDYIATPSFTVVAAVPTTTASALLPPTIHTTVTGQADAGPPLVLFILPGLLLIAAAIALLVIPALRRRSA